VVLSVRCADISISSCGLVAPEGRGYAYMPKGRRLTECPVRARNAGAAGGL
jgi:hypothetical protein